MKLFLIFSLFSSVLFASDFEEIPNKCLYTSKGKIKEVTCAQFNPSLKRRVKGVCIYNKGWKWGDWDPKHSGDKRFKAKKICDNGIEVVSKDLDEQDLTPIIARGPKNKKFYHFKNKAEIAADEEVGNCFLNYNSKSGSGEKPVSCSSNPGKSNFCEPRSISSVKKVRGVTLMGHYWLIYPKGKAKGKPKVCRGGIDIRQKDGVALPVGV